MCVLFLPPFKKEFKKSHSELCLFQISPTKFEELKSLFTRQKKCVELLCSFNNSFVVSIQISRSIFDFERIFSTFHSLLLLSGEFGVNLTFLLNFYCRQYMAFLSQGGTSLPWLCGWML